MGSGSLAVCLGTPFDVALVRMQADSMKVAADRRGYKNVFDALQRVAKEEGFRKLYRCPSITKCLVHFFIAQAGYYYDVESPPT
jgi:Mitochondrial carrier protein